MWCRGKDLVTLVRTLQIVLLHVQFVSCAVPTSVLQDGDQNQHDDKDNSGGGGEDKNPYQRHVKHKAYWGSYDSLQQLPNGLNSREHRWATAAFDFVHNLNCDDVFFTTSRECQELVSLPKSAMNIYMADPSPYGKFRTVIPDEPLTGTGLHESVVVVDPYPAANFGHLVIIFFLDGHVSRGHCQKMGGVYLDDDECMYLALRRRCRNALERLSRRRNYARRCEINFLPVVQLDTRNTDHERTHTHQHSHQHHNTHDDGQIQRVHNHLQCKSELAGFAQCPEFRAENATEGLLCNHLRDNTRRCDTTHETVRTSCRMFEVCDQAVLVSGGWNRFTSGERHWRNLELMYGMLRDSGFKRRNIKVFFANGDKDIHVDGDPPQKVYPAALKMALRNHIAKLCLAPHCVDSLFLYLNSPARSDGTSLLWDVNGDGLADEHERYTVRELKEDLAHCAARQVTVVIDQSFSGEVVQELRESPPHSNVIVFASGKSGEYSFGDEYTRFWSARNHTRACSVDIHGASRNAVKHSSPRMGEGEEGRIRTTIFGAPCDVRPPFTTRELRHSYFGCQNLPTAVWLREILRASDSTFPENSNDDESDDYDEDDDESL